MNKVLACVLMSLSLSAFASDFQAKFTQRFPKAVGAKFERAFPGFWAVAKGNEMLYVNDDLSILITGANTQVINLTKGENITARLHEQMQPRVDVSKLNLNDAIQLTTGSKKLFVLTDPDCPFCRQLEPVLHQLKDVSVYLFPFPLTMLHPNAAITAESIWCSKNKAAAWDAYALNEVAPVDAKCPNPIERNLKLGQQFGIQGTPTIIFEDGVMISRLATPEEIQSHLDREQPQAKK